MKHIGATLEQPFGQICVLPHLSVIEPQLTALQAFGSEQPHWFGTLAPPQVFGAVQLPGQVMVMPQLSMVLPHALPLQASTSSATQPHFAGVPVHTSLGTQAVQRVVSEQPLALSSGTHLLAQFFVSLVQEPTTQAEPEQMSVPVAPGFGQLLASQVSAPQPYVGSVMDTHWSPHFFVPVPHPAITHLPPLQVRFASPAGQLD